MFDMQEVKAQLKERYKFSANKSMEVLRDIFKTGKMDGDEYVVFVLEIADIDLEATLSFYEDDGVLLEYVVCKVNDEGDWETHDILDVDTSALADMDITGVEAEMFSVLMGYAEKHTLLDVMQ